MTLNAECKRILERVYFYRSVLRAGKSIENLFMALEFEYDMFVRFNTAEFYLGEEWYTLIFSKVLFLSFF